MRKFNHYKTEIIIAQDIKKGANKKDAEKVQQWINFHSPNRLKIDRNFGSQTEQAVKDFQKTHGLPMNGIVDSATFNILSHPLRKAFSIREIQYTDFRDLICKIAKIHANCGPIEFSIHGSDGGNRGPWVRSYCNGDENVYWCMGFVQTIFDHACDIANIDLSKIMSSSSNIIDCDTVANFALGKGYLIRNSALSGQINEIRPGDVFFKYSPDGGQKWHHTGIIVEKNGGDSVTTVEGNAASALHGAIGDTSNGTGAYRKTRDLFDNEILTQGGKTYRDCYEVYKINI